MEYWRDGFWSACMSAHERDHPISRDYSRATVIERQALRSDSGSAPRLIRPLAEIGLCRGAARKLTWWSECLGKLRPASQTPNTALGNLGGFVLPSC